MTFAGALAAVFVSNFARAQDISVEIQVSNRSFKAIGVRIYDMQSAAQGDFDGQILTNASVLVRGCPDQDDRATITIEDRFGHRETYPWPHQPFERGGHVRVDVDVITDFGELRGGHGGRADGRRGRRARASANSWWSWGCSGWGQEVGFVRVDF